MTRDELLKTLQTLHHELAGAVELDAETRQMLQAVTADIQTQLQRGEGGGGSSDLAARVRNSLVGFETRHPQLAMILERLTEGLAKLGI